MLSRVGAYDWFDAGEVACPNCDAQLEVKGQTQFFEPDRNQRSFSFGRSQELDLEDNASFLCDGFFGDSYRVSKPNPAAGASRFVLWVMQDDTLQCHCSRHLVPVLGYDVDLSVVPPTATLVDARLHQIGADTLPDALDFAHEEWFWFSSDDASRDTLLARLRARDELLSQIAEPGNPSLQAVLADMGHPALHPEIEEVVLRMSSISVDLSPLAGLTKLRVLDLSYSPIADLAPLAGLRGLRSLDLTQTKVCDLSPLAELEALRELKLDETGVTDIRPIAHLTGLEVLELNSLQIDDFGPLSSLVNLEELDLSKTNIDNLSMFENLHCLKRLGLEGTHVSDLTPIAGFLALRHLTLRGSKVYAEMGARLEALLPNCMVCGVVSLVPRPPST